MRGSYWMLVLGLGNMDSTGEILDSGLMFSVYESGPWVAFKYPDNPTVWWIGGGKELFEMMEWRHSCISLSRATGRFKLVENGQIAADKYSDEIIKNMEKIPHEVRYTRTKQNVAHSMKF